MPTRVGYIAAIVGIIGFSIQISIWGYGAYMWLQPAPTQLSAADLLVIDQNPTKVMVTNVSIDSAESIDGQSVFLTLTNKSSVTAKNVRLDIYNHLGAWVPLSEPFANGYKGAGDDIPAGESRRYRIASIAEYAKLFNPKDPRSKLLRVSTKIQDENSFELSAVVCGTQDGDTGSCAFNSKELSTVVRLRYGSIFGQKCELLTQFYNTFLEGKVSR